MADALRRLAGDPDPGVRANAVWSLGTIGKIDAIGLLGGLLRDPDVAVAGNAAAALGRIAARERAPAAVAGMLCKALADPRSYLRANALAGLSIASGACESATVRNLLSRDPSEAVRLAAADALARSFARAGAAASAADRRAVGRCAGEDKNATVASRCAEAVRLGTPAASTATGPSPLEDVAVFVVPDGRGAPVARAPFALVRTDGLLRLGTADRRGEIFEFRLPRGTIRLAVPAPLAR
jgi:HEAT repeat protein